MIKYLLSFLLLTSYIFADSNISNINTPTLIFEETMAEFSDEGISCGFLTLSEILENEIRANLGKLISMIGILLSLLSSLFFKSKRKKVIIFGIILSLLVGSSISIIDFYFGGDIGFNPNDI